MKSGIRFFDILLSLVLLISLAPFMLLIYLGVKLTSGGQGIFSQIRVGKDNKDFTLYKFRTMQVNTESIRSLTVGTNDSRITRFGSFLRKYKLDELPQLWNVLKGEMSMVGPRPELRKYVECYTEEQKEILSVRPGITDFASLVFKDENEILGGVQDPENYYIKEVIPIKINLNRYYLSHRNLRIYFLLIFKTVFSVSVKQKSNSGFKTL